MLIPKTVGRFPNKVSTKLLSNKLPIAPPTIPTKMLTKMLLALPINCPARYPARPPITKQIINSISLKFVLLIVSESKGAKKSQKSQHIVQ